MKVEFLRDVFNAGTRMYEAGKAYEGDLERYVRRGDAVEVKGAGETQSVAQTAATETGKVKGKRK